MKDLIQIIIFTLFCFSFINSQKATVYYQNGQYSLIKGSYDFNGAAWGSYNDSLDLIGWGQLNVYTNPSYPDSVQMHAAGYLEGALTHSRIFQHRHNIYDWMLNHYAPNKIWSPSLYKFLEDNLNYTKDNIKKYSAEDPYWQATGYILDQFEGLVEGYQKYYDSGEKLTELDLFMYNSAGDLLDLATALSETRPKIEEMTEDEIMMRHFGFDHCTGFIKLADNYSDIFVAQDTWFTYGCMNRIFKHYEFNLNDPFIKCHKLSFSSYPGLLFSFDDHYILDTGLAALETTFDIFNMSLYDLVQPKCILEWMRVRIAHSMADTAPDWVLIFSRENSGSYNNQWLILDYKQFTPGTKPKENTLWCLEQVPGMIVSDDITDTLINQTYVPSYNIPSFEIIFNITGYPAMVKRFGNSWSYVNCSRAKIFRRNSSEIQTLEDMKKIMRYNQWKTDPLSLYDPANAPCSRVDLRPFGHLMKAGFGGLDSKIVSYESAQNMTVYAISSPTYDDQPVFKFSTCPFIFEHVGLPDTYDFPWQTFEWVDDQKPKKQNKKEL
ncbi:phospholipase b [Anaeramoeba ignava]|uniref:Phospholipase B-like n=1 Tax=Anaeramoeba ignava TaxID=1746090 RepID=A0A9Q0LMB8_ANAIG|nr:phospholipase b [Anaeramoeba ignava]